VCDFIDSLDGGGVRSLLQLEILKRMVERYPHLLENVDMIAGKTKERKKRNKEKK
jgi:patatin-like phospholipase/acyl hydrolase